MASGSAQTGFAKRKKTASSNRPKKPKPEKKTVFTPEELELKRKKRRVKAQLTRKRKRELAKALRSEDSTVREAALKKADENRLQASTSKRRKKKKAKQEKSDEPGVSQISALAAALALAQKKANGDSAAALVNPTSRKGESKKRKSDDPKKSHAEIRAEKQAVKQAKRIKNMEEAKEKLRQTKTLLLANTKGRYSKGIKAKDTRKSGRKVAAEGEAARKAALERKKLFMEQQDEARRQLVGAQLRGAVAPKRKSLEELLASVEPKESLTRTNNNSTDSSSSSDDDSNSSSDEDDS